MPASTTPSARPPFLCYFCFLALAAHPRATRPDAGLAGACCQQQVAAESSRQTPMPETYSSPPCGLLLVACVGPRCFAGSSTTTGPWLELLLTTNQRRPRTGPCQVHPAPATTPAKPLLHLYIALLLVACQDRLCGGPSCYSPPTNADPGQDLARSTPLRPRHRQDHCCICTPRCCSLHVKTVSVRLHQVPLPPSTSSQDQVPLRTNVNDYRRKNGTGKSEDPKYHDTDDMNIYGMCTTSRHCTKYPDGRSPRIHQARLRTENNYHLRRTM
ncbi:hypothetical protein VPH35_065927 [Triticum aestivum]